MTPRDAFELPYLLTEVTLPLAARVVLEKHGDSTSKLSDAADRVDLEPFFQRIDEIVSRAKIAAPSMRPANASELRTWSQSFVIPNDNVLSKFGRTIGRVIQSLRLSELLVPLLAASPSDYHLVERRNYHRNTHAMLVANVANQSGLPVSLSDAPARLAKMSQVAELRAEVERIASVLKGEVTQPTISREDANLLMQQASEVGVPYFGLEFTDVVLMTAGPALAQHIEEQQHAYRRIDVSSIIAEIEARLKRAQLSVPPRPNSYKSWLQWNIAIAQAVGDNPARSEAMLAARSLAVVKRLREVDSTNAELIFYERSLLV